MRMLALLTIFAVPLASRAGQRRQSFRVGAVVTRSARLQAFTAADGSARLRMSPVGPVVVQTGEAAPRIERTAETELPAGTTRVTVHY
jgi:hypothetical protein